jgi:ribosome-binding factor A
MKKTESRRSVRLADQLMREIALMVTEELQDPRLNLVSISGVRLNADMSIAEVLYTVSGDEARRAEVQAALEHAKGYLRTRLGKILKLRYLPDLRFKFDEFLEDMVYGHPGPESRS